jgi:Na+-driven multidrug efflux pump
LIYLFPRAVLGVFITDTAVLELAKGLLMIALWSSVPFGMATVFSGAMRAGGVALAPMLLSMSAIVAIEIPAAVILNRTIGWTASGPPTRSCSAPCSSCNSAITRWSGVAGRFSG